MVEDGMDIEGIDCLSILCYIFWKDFYGGEFWGYCLFDVVV